jgi:hypothetical protein
VPKPTNCTLSPSATACVTTATNASMLSPQPHEAGVRNPKVASSHTDVEFDICQQNAKRFRKCAGFRVRAQSCCAGRVIDCSFHRAYSTQFHVDDDPICVPGRCDAKRANRHNAFMAPRFSHLQEPTCAQNVCLSATNRKMLCAEWNVSNETSVRRGRRHRAGRGGGA